jgi:hypothetical protein
VELRTDRRRLDLTLGRKVSFGALPDADLVVDAVYEGGKHGDVRDDPLARLLPCGNQGGFRYLGRPGGGYRIAVLYSSGVDPDWPDRLNPETGVFTYYGDNKRPGSTVQATTRGGNRLLESAFGARHGTVADPFAAPPFFVFLRAGTGRDVRFVGLAVPGAMGVSEAEDLVAIWRTSSGLRFQNYRATFTILDVPVVSRTWIAELATGEPRGSSAPLPWLEWLDGGVYRPLVAQRTTTIRSRQQQEPGTAAGQAILQAIHDHFRSRPHDFELCADRIWRMIAPNVTASDLTRPSRDGGRDSIGLYSLGPAADPIRIDFALEAKCYQPGNAVGVREMSRLISRLRHRQFGVMVTTSHVHQQAYQEVRDDQHPIAIVAGRDIVEALKATGIVTVAGVKAWLSALDDERMAKSQVVER